MSSPSEIAAIEGFDEDTAEEIQARARDYLDKEAAEYDARRRELGVEDARAGGRGRDACRWRWRWARAR